MRHHLILRRTNAKSLIWVDSLALLFPSNMPWSESVIEQFGIVDLYTTEESDFYGPINSLLVELFPSSEHYQVSPQFKRIDGSVDFTVQFIVHCSSSSYSGFFPGGQDLPFAYAALRPCNADDQMRQGFRRQPSMASALLAHNFVFIPSNQPPEASIRPQSLVTWS
jgi:hypothetical protein